MKEERWWEEEGDGKACVGWRGKGGVTGEN